MLVASQSPPLSRLYSADELLLLPDNARFELLEGKLYAMAPASDLHGEDTILLSSRITVFVDDNDLGSCRAAETGFLLARDPDVVLAPDFAFIRKERLTYPRGRGFVPIAPDLVIETRSPSDRAPDVAAKVARWLVYGVTVVIDADPEKRVLTVHRAETAPQILGVDDTLTLPDLLPGFSLRLARVF